MPALSCGPISRIDAELQGLNREQVAAASHPFPLLNKEEVVIGKTRAGLVRRMFSDIDADVYVMTDLGVTYTCQAPVSARTNGSVGTEKHELPSVIA